LRVKKMWKSFKSRYLYTIRNQFVAFILISIVIPILIVQFINYNLTTQIITNKNNAILSDNMTLSNRNANNVIRDYRELLYEITTDDTFLNKMSILNNTIKESKQFLDCSDAITGRINTLCLMHPEVRVVGIVDESGKTIIVDQFQQQNKHIEEFFLEKSGLINKNTISSRDPLLDIIQPENQFYDKNDPIFYISYRAFDLVTTKMFGSIVLFIQPSILNDSINDKSNATYDFSDKMIITSNNLVLCGKTNENIGKNANEIAGYEKISFSTKVYETEYKKQNIEVILMDTNDFGLKMVDVIDKNMLLSEIYRQLLISSGLIFAVMFIAILIAYILSQNIVKSILRMSCVINEFNKDNLDISVSESSKNEVRLLESSFNSMVSRINKLIQENTQQYEHIVQITKDSNIAEIKSLELEINPHFLFNTIDTINWMAIREGSADVSEQLNNLACILRYTTYNLNGVVKLKDEIAWLEHYLALQKNRFPNRFGYEIIADESVLDFLIHKMILQPFIENAIIHGFEGIQYRGSLTVSMNMLKGKYLLIKITDNGCGIPPEKIKQINQLFHTRDDKYKFGIGLENIAFRIYRYYNGKAKIYASSNREVTCFKLFIPKDLEGGN